MLELLEYVTQNFSNVTESGVMVGFRVWKILKTWRGVEYQHFKTGLGVVEKYREMMTKEDGLDEGNLEQRGHSGGHRSNLI